MARLKALLAALSPLQVDLPQALTKFTLFPKLSLELRSRVWYYVANTQRKVRIWQHVNEDDLVVDAVLPSNYSGTNLPSFRNISSILPAKYFLPLTHYQIVVEAQSHIPDLLTTCRESGTEGLRHYHKLEVGSLENFSMCINPAADLFIFEKVPSGYNTHEDDTQHSLTFLEGNDFNIDLLDLGIPQNYAIVADNEEVMVENTQKLIGLLERSQTEHLTFIFADHYAINDENHLFSSKHVPYNAFQGSGAEDVDGCLVQEKYRRLVDGIFEFYRIYHEMDLDFNITIKWKKRFEPSLFPCSASGPMVSMKDSIFVPIHDPPVRPLGPAERGVDFVYAQLDAHVDWARGFRRNEEYRT